MRSDIEMESEARAGESRRPCVFLEYAFQGVHQRVQYFFNGQVSVRTREHELMQSSAQKHFEPCEYMRVEGLEDARHGGWNDARPYVVCTSGGQHLLREMARMSVHQQDGLSAWSMRLQCSADVVDDFSKHFVIYPC